MSAGPKPPRNPLLKGYEPVNYSITREYILLRAEGHLNMIDQHVRHGFWDDAAKETGSAEALIELLEIDDCGSSGGFDTKRGQLSPDRLEGKLRLRDRFDWLKRLPIGESEGTQLKRLRDQLNRIK
jgi:hypothetical protein